MRCQREERSLPIYHWMKRGGKFWKKFKAPRLPQFHIKEWISDHREGLFKASKVSLVVGTLSLIVLLVHSEVYSLIRGKPEFSVKAEKFRVSLVPDWANGQNSVTISLNGSDRGMMEEGTTEWIGLAFQANPWVKEVSSVERVFPDQIRVRFEYRDPVAAVKTSEGWIVVDEDRVRLPGIWKERPPCALQADIVGLHRAPLPGEVWNDPALAAGIDLARYVLEDSVLSSVDVAAIDVSNFDGRIDSLRSEMAFSTNTGCVIYWGRPLSTDKYGELTQDEKVGNLRMVLKDFPGLENLVYVKVYYKRGEAAVLERNSQLGTRR
jgi:hypothetical protein